MGTLSPTQVANLIWYFYCHFGRNTTKNICFDTVGSWQKNAHNYLKGNQVQHPVGRNTCFSTKRFIIYQLRQIWQPRHQRRHMNASISERSLISCRPASNMNEFTQGRGVIHASTVISALAVQDIVKNMNELTQERGRMHVIIVIKALAPHRIVSNMNEFTQEWNRIHASIAERDLTI